MKKTKDLKTYLSLFSSFFRISLFTLGGGAVMLPLMEDEFVNKKKLINHSDMLDIISLTNSLPGVIAINSSVLIGNMTAGFIGAVCSVLGVIIPPFLIILLLAEGLFSLEITGWIEALFIGVRAGVTALLLSVVVRFSKKNLKTAAEIIIAVLAFLLVRFFQINAIFVLLGAGLLGLILFRPTNLEVEK